MTTQAPANDAHDIRLDAAFDPRTLRLLTAGTFAVALIVLVALIRPFEAGPVAADAASSVIYWQRITSGTRLEAFVNTTPKPLLTLVYGLAWSLTSDWRSISAIAILVTSIAATVGARLALRVGGLVAAALAAIYLVLASSILAEVSWAYGLPWFIGCLMGAGLALTATRPRWGTAGVLMLLGALVRPEMFLAIGVASAVVVVQVLRGRLPARAALILVGWGALPIMLVHDMLLAGDPLHWLRVSALYAEGSARTSFRSALRQLITVVIGNPAIPLLAAVGLIGAWRTAAGRVVAIGIVTIGAGTAALVLSIGAMGRPLVPHYYSPIEVAMAFSAALGVGYIVAAVRSLLARRTIPGGTAAHTAAVGRPATPRSMAAGILVAVVGLGLGLLVLRPVLIDRAAIGSIDHQREIAIRTDAIAPRIAEIASTLPVPPPLGARGFPVGSSYPLLVPRFVRSRLGAELGLPQTLLGPLVAGRPTPGRIHPGVIVYHEAVTDPKTALTKAFEGASPAVVEGVTFDLLWTDGHGAWLWKARGG